MDHDETEGARRWRVEVVEEIEHASGVTSRLEVIGSCEGPEPNQFKVRRYELRKGPDAEAPIRSRCWYWALDNDFPRVLCDSKESALYTAGLLLKDRFGDA